MKKESDLNDSEGGRVVGPRQAGVSISEAAELLGFSHTNYFQCLQRMVLRKEKISPLLSLYTYIKISRKQQFSE